MDRRWTSLLRELTDESGPWSAAHRGSSKDPTRPPYKWKLDSAEDSSHRRLRLKRDYHYVVYRDEDRDGEKAAGSLGVSVNADEMSKLVGGDALRVRKTEEDDGTMDEAAVASAEAEAEAAAAAKAAEAEREGDPNFPDQNLECARTRCGARAPRRQAEEGPAALG